jgi:hypothetical protein
VNAVKQASPAKAKYLYAIAAWGEDRTLNVQGIDGSAVYFISKDGVAAVVSDCNRPKIRPERANLAAHWEVLKQLMRTDTVVPMAFGMIADDATEVRRMLSRNKSVLREQLDHVAGHVEMGLRVTWDVPNIFEYFVETHTELRATRDRLMGGSQDVQQDAKLELGQMFDRFLNEDRESHYEKIADALGPCCTEIKRSPPRNLSEVVNVNCLVLRDRQKQLEDAIFTAAAQFDNNFAFDLNGPWAPHNFVEMQLALNGQK